MGGTTSSVDFFSWLLFLLWGALRASPLDIWLIFVCFYVIIINVIITLSYNLNLKIIIEYWPNFTFDVNGIINATIVF